MNIAIWIMSGIMTIPCAIIGILFLNGKAHYFLNEKHMSVQVKVKYDMNALRRFAGWILLAFALWWALFVLGMGLWMPPPHWAIMMFSIMGAGGIGVIIYKNKGKRLRQIIYNKADGVELDVSNETREKSVRLSEQRRERKVGKNTAPY
jgi:hypothetical protein